MQWIKFSEENKSILPYVAISAGTGAADEEKLDTVLKKVPEVTMICLDVANGYSEHFVETVRKYRKKYPSHTIIAGNVVTGTPKAPHEKSTRSITNKFEDD